MLSLVLLVLQFGDPIGSGLRDGTRLTYESGGNAQAPWVYVDVQLADPGEFDRCVRVTREGQPPRESCARGDTLFEGQASGEFRPVRPIGADMELELVTASGSRMHYATGQPSTRTIGDQVVSYLPTTILTRDASGRVTRRLREQYAPSLLTAVWGVFEEPDGAGGWRTIQEFVLAEIRHPEGSHDG